MAHLPYPLYAHCLQLPSNSGVDLTQVETDSAVVETVQCLVELSKDSLDIIGLALADVLDKLAKVRHILFCPLLTLIFCSYYSKQMRITFGRSMSFSPSCLSSRSFLLQWRLDGTDIQTIRAPPLSPIHPVRLYPCLLWPPAAVV